MAFPVVEGIQISNTSGGTDHAVTMPASIQVGELLIAFFVSDNDESDIGWPTGADLWNEILDQYYSSVGPTLSIAWRIADGTEGASINVTTPDSEVTAAMVCRISGYDSDQAPEVSTSAGTSSTTPDPDSLTPTGGGKDYLWIAVEGNDNGEVYPSGWPTNYADNQTISTRASTAGACVSIATRDLNATAEDPGTFTLTAQETWVACTVAVHPTAGVGAVAPTAALYGPLVGALGGPI